MKLKFETDLHQTPLPLFFLFSSFLTDHMFGNLRSVIPSNLVPLLYKGIL